MAAYGPILDGPYPSALQRRLEDEHFETWGPGTERYQAMAASSIISAYYAMLECEETVNWRKEGF